MLTRSSITLRMWSDISPLEVLSSEKIWYMGNSEETKSFVCEEAAVSISLVDRGFQGTMTLLS